MKVKIEFELPYGIESGYNNQAEAVHILRHLAHRIDMEEEWPTKVLDVNGNSIGQIQVEE